MPLPAPLASLRRRLASLVYECLLLLALWFVAGFIVVGALPEPPHGLARVAFQTYLWLVTGVYLVWFWRRGGQTLAMRTWQLRLVDLQGRPVGRRQAWLRYLLASLGALALGAGFLWAILDRERQFLHDRLAGTRLLALTPFDIPKTGRGKDAEEDQRHETAEQGRPVV
jgi:uncharacterized RDD family membrane protein YckC